MTGGTKRLTNHHRDVERSYVIIKRSIAEFGDEMPRPLRPEFHGSIVEGFYVDTSVLLPVN